MRLRLDLGYDGTAFSGWAAQPGRRTVQGVLESALRTVLRVPEARLTVAGRTDAGVHARGQVCHVDLDLEHLDLAELRRRLNRMLPDDIAVRQVSEPAIGFDARFSATWRRYTYRLCDDDALAEPLRRHEVLRWPRRVDHESMNAAAAGLLGEHDFAAFCKRREGASTVRRLREMVFERDGGLVSCRVVADSFCHNMVRSLVGCLLVVGEGKQPVGWPAEVLASAVRSPRVPVLPPHGLVLDEVGYPDDPKW